ncbi:MAG: ornithine cyclodeaminase family protein [Paracoccaceae bacterium]|nr:ornithine cyclodeaminase family protein [Paracoccaceae bacterium]
MMDAPGLPSPEVHIDVLNRFDIEGATLTDAEILTAVETGLAMQGQGLTALEPRTHIRPRAGADGHFNVLRGWIGGDIDSAGTKVVGDFVDNYREGRPSEYGILTLFDPRTGAPKAILDATGITEMRTGAMTAIGARHLAPPNPRVLGHVGARGTAYWNVRLLASLFDFDEIRVHSRRPESRDRFAARLASELDRTVIATEDWKSCLEGADILVEASRLRRPEPHFRTEWIKPGSLVVHYGTMSAVELSITGIMDKIVMDDWGQAHGSFGALREHVDQGLLTADTLHAELADIVVGTRPGRETDHETILFWHRGLSLSDIALGHAFLRKAHQLGLGQRIRFC